MFKFIKPLALLLSTTFFCINIYAQKEEDEDGKLEEILAKRIEMLENTSGTKNFTLLDYREAIKSGNALHTNGVTPLNGNWTQINQAHSTTGMGRINCFEFQPGSSTIIYVGTPTGGLWKTTNSGTTWSNVTAALPVPGVSGICIDPNNVNNIYILTGTASSIENQSLGVFKSVDGGTTWLPTGLDTTYQPLYGNIAWNAHKLLMDPSNSNILYACMTDGLYKTQDGASTWTKVYPASGQQNVVDMAFYPGNSNYIYISLGGGVIVTSKDAFTTFSSYQNLPNTFGTGYNSTTIAVTPAAPDSIFFALTKIEPATGVREDSVYIGRGYFNTSTNTISFGTVNKCFYSLNNISNPVAGYVTSALRWYRDARLAVSPTTTSKMYIGGLDTYASNNYGKNWILKTNDNFGNATIHTDCSQMRYISTNVYSTNDGGIYTQAASETTTPAWTSLTGTLPNAQIYKIGASQISTTDFNVALQDNGCHIRTASTYTQLQVGDGVVARMDPNNNLLYYGAYVGGASLTKYRNGTAFSINPTAGFEPAGSGYGFLPFEVDQNNGKTLYTAYTSFYKSVDTGNTWTRTNFGGVNETKLMAISKSNPNVIWLFEDISFIMRKSTNGGSSFSVVTLPVTIPNNIISSIVISPFNENIVYLTIDGYSAGNKVFITTNGGSTWQNITRTLPNVPIYCLAYESNLDNSIYVGTEIGVYYYNDNIGNWIPFNNGMPLCRLSEFYINRTTNNIIAATYGRGMFISDLYSSCSLNLTLSGNVSGLNTFSALSQLTSTQNITGGAASNTKYYAGNLNILQPGFYAPTGSKFVAGIAPCGGKIDIIQNKKTPALKKIIRAKYKPTYYQSK